ncbi:MAG: RidA family protein, partial [Pseudomonadota bacterium]
SHYAHGVEIGPGARVIYCAGQVGIAPDGTVPAGIEAQTELCLANVAAILAEGGMGPKNLVRLTSFVTDRADLPGYMAARNRFIAGLANPPASTLMIVSGFARPEMRVEIEAIAAEEP